jgi:hypothetical protein
MFLFISQIISWKKEIIFLCLLFGIVALLRKPNFEMAWQKKTKKTEEEEKNWMNKFLQRAWKSFRISNFFFMLWRLHSFHFRLFLSVPFIMLSTFAPFLPLRFFLSLLRFFGDDFPVYCLCPLYFFFFFFKFSVSSSFKIVSWLAISYFHFNCFPHLSFIVPLYIFSIISSNFLSLSRSILFSCEEWIHKA